MPETEFLDDKELVAGCVRDDRRKQELLYRKYAKTMFKICVAYEPNHDLAKDILQDAFIKVFKTISTYSHQGSLQGWIRRIITNTAIDHFRQAKIAESRFFAIDSLERSEEPHLNGNGILESEDILKVVKQLPDGARLVFNLYSLEGYNHKEISEMLGISEGTSKSQLSRAKQLLQEWLTEFR